MTWHDSRVVTASAGSAQSFSEAVDLGRYWPNIYVLPSTNASGGRFYVRMSETLDGTYNRLYNIHVPSTATVEQNVFRAHENIAIGGHATPIPGNLRFVKLEWQTAPTATATIFRFVCS